MGAAPPLVRHRRHSRVAFGEVTEENLDVVARTILLLGLLLRHDQANHVGLGLGGVSAEATRSATRS
jgi:hypothetical protein